MPNFVYSPFAPTLRYAPEVPPKYGPFDYIGHLRTTDGAALRYGLARPVGPVRGVVLLLQGRAECLEKYAEIVRGLVDRDLAVYSFDWHGQGLSARWRRGTVRSFDDYLEDLDLFLREVWCRPVSRPYLIAHSTGGHVALRYMAERRWRVAGAVLCAPMIDLQTGVWPRWFAPWLAGGAVGLGLGDCLLPGEKRHLPSRRCFEGNSLTSDPDRFRILPELVRVHPGLECRGATYRWIHAAFRSMVRLNRPGVAEAITNPVTVMVGAEDKIIDIAALQAFAARLPQGRMWPVVGASHEIMMENDAILGEFWRAVDAMLDGRR